MQLQTVLLSLVAVVVGRPEAGYTPSSGYLPGGSSNYYSGFTHNTGGTNNYNYQNSYQDRKSVYFFSAPDDNEVSRLRIYVQPSSGRNAKIIFIKAPSQGHIVPEVIAPPSEAIDRTLVYVLSKNQAHGGSITIPAGLGIKQAKPEVYFLKYKNQHDAHSAVYHGLNGQSVGTGLDDLGNAQAFTSTLGGNRGFGVGGIADGGYNSGNQGFGNGGIADGGYTSGNQGFGNGGIADGGYNSGYNSGYSVQSGGANTKYGPPSGSGPYYR